jgi:uncharacterized protein YbjQ (UPF0145 family)
MPKADPQATLNEIATERTVCRTVMLAVNGAGEMTASLRHDLEKLLQRYESLSDIKQSDALRELKIADVMTEKLRSRLSGTLRRYDKLLEAKQKDAVRDLKTAARKR